MQATAKRADGGKRRCGCRLTPLPQPTLPTHSNLTPLPSAPVCTGIHAVVRASSWWTRMGRDPPHRHASTGSSSPADDQAFGIPDPQAHHQAWTRL
eukprot:scaffold24863_cov112-Isochrysis_galbana.AAC.3